jgi:hypothetical protein
MNLANDQSIHEGKKVISSIKNKLDEKSAEISYKARSNLNRRLKDFTNRAFEALRYLITSLYRMEDGQSTR